MKLWSLNTLNNRFSKLDQDDQQLLAACVDFIVDLMNRSTMKKLAMDPEILELRKFQYDEWDDDWQFWDELEEKINGYRLIEFSTICRRNTKRYNKIRGLLSVTDHLEFTQGLDSNLEAHKYVLLRRQLFNYLSKFNRDEFKRSLFQYMLKEIDAVRYSRLTQNDLDTTRETEINFWKTVSEIKKPRHKY